MSIFLAKLIDSALDVTAAGARGLARRQAEQKLGGRKPKAKEPSCSICTLPARQERAANFVRDVEVLAGTRDPSRRRVRSVVRRQEGASE